MSACCGRCRGCDACADDRAGGVWMRVLFLSQVLPYPLDAGPKVRAYYTVRHLAQRHAVSLLTFVRPGDPPGAIEHLRGICESVETINMRRGRPRDAWHLARSLV